MPPLLKPSLYAATELGPVLLGGRCSCGHVFFPMQTFGCEQCGRTGEAVLPQDLRARGVLLTASVVHLHADKRRAVPFAIGTIALDEGPVIRALLSDVTLASEAVQKTVQAEWVAITVEDGTQALDLRFKRETKDTALSGER